MLSSGERSSGTNNTEDIAQNWPVVRHRLFAPQLEDVVTVLQNGLEECFEEVSVKVVDCPDLTLEPFLLADKGICGQPRAADIGGVPYIIPVPDMKKIYDLSEIRSWCDMSSTSSVLAIGAGAASPRIVGKLAELIVNVGLDPSGKLRNCTRYCKIDDKTGCYMLQKSENSSESCHLTNLFVSEGQPGKVIEVRAKQRKDGSTGFISAMQTCVRNHYGSNPVCIGGVFVLNSGKARIHVMPGYSAVPLINDEMVDEWLRFYDMSSPLTAVGYLVSHDPGLNLRMEHFHCYSEHGDGGHFHYDVTPASAEYIGYFNVAEYMIRVDKFADDLKPIVSH